MKTCQLLLILDRFQEKTECIQKMTTVQMSSTLDEHSMEARCWGMRIDILRAIFLNLFNSQLIFKILRK